MLVLTCMLSLLEGNVISHHDWSLFITSDHFYFHVTRGQVPMFTTGLTRAYLARIRPLTTMETDALITLLL